MMAGSPSSLSNTTESFWKRTRKRRRLISITQFLKKIHMKLVGNATKCCILGTIVASAGSRVAILANEIICDHDLRHNTRRLHWPCDCSKRRSSTFRKACDTKARTQGHVEEELAKPAAAAAWAAAAAAHFTHRRTKSLETEGDLGKQGRSARRLETHHRSGSSTWKQDAIHFSNGCGYSPRWQKKSA